MFGVGFYYMYVGCCLGVGCALLQKVISFCAVATFCKCAHVFSPVCVSIDLDAKGSIVFASVSFLIAMLRFTIAVTSILNAKLKYIVAIKNFVYAINSFLNAMLSFVVAK